MNISEHTFFTERNQMVDNQLRARDIADLRVLAAMQKVKRELFVPGESRQMAYWDTPLAIGFGQTVSQPYIVALMTQLARIHPTDVVLEIGTGSGYQTAILAELAAHVCTMEIETTLAMESKILLEELGYRNIDFSTSNGYEGWPEHKLFDAIIVTAAPPHLPEKLLEQLANNGRLVAPIGSEFQDLYLIEKRNNATHWQEICSVVFVPMRQHSHDSGTLFSKNAAKNASKNSTEATRGSGCGSG